MFNDFINSIQIDEANQTDFWKEKSDYKKYFKPDEEIVAINKSRWSWEYDRNERYAFITINKDNDWRILVVETQTKTGIGSGKWSKILLDEKIGNGIKVKIPNIGKFSHENSRASHPFSKKWNDINEKEFPLKEILEKEMNQRELSGSSKAGSSSKEDLFNKIWSKMDKDFRAKTESGDKCFLALTDRGTVLVTAKSIDDETLEKLAKSYKINESISETEFVSESVVQDERELMKIGADHYLTVMSLVQKTLKQVPVGTSIEMRPDDIRFFILALIDKSNILKGEEGVLDKINKMLKVNSKYYK